VTAHGWRPSKASTFRSSCSALVREVGLPPAALVAEVGDECAESWRRGQTGLPKIMSTRESESAG